MSLQEFLDRLDTTGVLSLEQVREAIEAVPAEQRPEDDLQLSALLVRKQLLTPYQADVLQKGHRLLLGNYMLIERVGRGGMGEVFKAVHRRMNRTVALKVLNRTLAQNPDAMQRFQREARAAALLSHPNIVAAYDADESDGVHFLVMEYVEGFDLDHYLRVFGPLTPAQAIQVILQVARGLEYAHGKGVVHRDIKPANLMLDRSGLVRILDMGLAHMQEQDEDFTKSYHVFGSVDYMSPEQAESAKRADARSDIYSLGCTLYTLASGNAPYGGESTIQKFLAHREDPIPSLCEAAGEVTTELDAVFRRMVAKAPDDRYQSTRELIEDLEPLSQEDAEALESLAQLEPAPQVDPDAPTVMRGSNPAPDTQFGSTPETGWWNALPTSAPRVMNKRESRRWVWGVVAVVGLALAVVGYLFSISFFRLGDDAPYLPQAEKPELDIPGAANLLAGIDLKRDSIGGVDWLRDEGDALLSPIANEASGPPMPSNGAILQFPDRPPEHYELHLVVEPRSGPGPFLVGIPVGQDWVMLMIERPRPGMRISPRRIPDFVAWTPSYLKCVVHSDGRVEAEGTTFTFEPIDRFDPLYDGLATSATPGHLVIAGVGSFRVSQVALLPLEPRQR